MDVKTIQLKLEELKYNPGPIDGIWGRGSIAALKRFQAIKGLPADGVPGPKTMAMLFPLAVTGGERIMTPALSVPPWLSEARRKTGLTEAGKGRQTLMQWLRSDGHTLGDPAKLPWCGDFVETCIALTLPDEKLPVNPYYATNWSKFGTPSLPAVGAILVFQRPGGGHVGFCEGMDSDYFFVRGGNQANSVSVTRVAKSRLVGTRWPTTYPKPAVANWRMGQNTSGAPITTNEA